MKYTLLSIISALILTSCASSFNIQGSTDLQNLDGRMLYIKAQKGDEIHNVDSCDVVHGMFAFKGTIDTVKVGALFINNESVMPVVLEEGEISLQLNTARQSCSGTPLNDKLSEFIEQYNQITSQISDLSHVETQAIMDGKDLDLVRRELMVKASELNDKLDKCITEFIEQNFDNVLGPFVFKMATGDMEVPMTNPWIEALMTKATDSFKNDAYVKDFMDAAKRNEAIMTGMDEPELPQVDNIPPHTLPTTPTPNELAKPVLNKEK